VSGKPIWEDIKAYSLLPSRAAATSNGRAKSSRAPSRLPTAPRAPVAGQSDRGSGGESQWQRVCSGCWPVLDAVHTAARELGGGGVTQG
jgi:hypothetical protein